MYNRLFYFVSMYSPKCMSPLLYSNVFLSLSHLWYIYLPLSLVWPAVMRSWCCPHGSGLPPLPLGSALPSHLSNVGQTETSFTAMFKHKRSALFPKQHNIQTSAKEWSCFDWVLGVSVRNQNKWRTCWDKGNMTYCLWCSVIWCSVVIVWAVLKVTPIICL